MKELLYRIQFHDDQQAFKAFYQQQMYPLYQFALAFLKQHQPAEEAVNDVFVKLWQRRHTLHEIDNIKVYLYVAVKHTALNQLRAVTPFMEMDLDNIQGPPVRPGAGAEQLLLTHELQDAIAAAIRQLPPKCRMIFKLIREDGLSYKEVAGILNISPKTVDAQLTIAMKKMSASLQPFLQHTTV
ncbi:RNA polymerase sigma-70 factor [Chitinophaga qingshengii]|uniref:RNA polymerase sigma-70 factor n=1 Tax=Chitinophaga qingshengii TaxID=1569794 RepID=A0ABR7TLG4_9BACT|nr:RNA polymerase sigma-70 factor [Chitinophaga qingshengii]MBC9929904.1 RNA polymerase sigma-70 factor [Chitinophaga qingshengii]